MIESGMLVNTNRLNFQTTVKHRFLWYNIRRYYAFSGHRVKNDFQKKTDYCIFNCNLNTGRPEHRRVPDRRESAGDGRAAAGRADYGL